MTPVIWLLGLSGSGKTTLGSLLRLYLDGQGLETEFIDGDRFRRRFGYTGFSPEDRTRNIDAMRDYALQAHARGKICVVAAITPYESMRQKNRLTLPLYHEVWVRCSLATLVQRDVKGLYSQAALGQVDYLSGVSDTFDEPRNADCIIDTDCHLLAESYQQLRDLALTALDAGQHWQQLRRMLPEVPQGRYLYEAIAL